MNDKIVKHLNEKLEQLLLVFPSDMRTMVRDTMYFAGGCIVDQVLGDRIRDYDVFLKTEAAAVAIHNYFKTGTFPFVKAVTDNAVTLVMDDGTVFQVITRFYGDTERVFKTFDFSHCKSYFDPALQVLQYDEEVILNKQLHYDGVKDEYTLNTLKRMCKFVARGWTPDNETIVNLYNAIQKRPPLSNPIEHRAQTIGFYGSSFK